MKRREFVAAAGVAGLASAAANSSDKPALLGGSPVRTERFPSWPVTADEEERALLGALRSKHWNRGAAVDRFEEVYAKLTGAKHCLAVANGTSALVTSLSVLGVGPGDEVIVPPYTFVATVNAVLAHGALPVFVDVDAATFQMDASKIAGAVNDRTVAILPVHIGGGVANLDEILAAAGKAKVPVIEDACQSHLAEWKGAKVGSFGKTGCFSFQASKNLNCGEGGALITSDGELVERAYAFHNNGRGRRNSPTNFQYEARALNLRMTEFQAALLLSQMERLELQSRTREQNAAHLTAMLREIPGIAPARTAPGCTRNAYHLYMFRYDASKFAGLSREKFLKALRAEGVPASGGYSPLNKEAYLMKTFESRGFSRVVSKERLRRWQEQNECPVNDRLCGEAVWFTQTMLLGPKESMDDIASAIRKIQAHAGELAKA